MKRELLLKPIGIIQIAVILLISLFAIGHAEDLASKKHVKGQAYCPVKFERMGIIKTWNKYNAVLSWGKGQTMAALDDGCDMTVPEWKTKLPWGPKVVAGYDAVDNDNDPSPGPDGYHGTTIAFPSSLNHNGKLGVAFNNSVAQIRSVSVVHLRSDQSASIARALQWVIDNHKRYNIRTRRKFHKTTVFHYIHA